MQINRMNWNIEICLKDIEYSRTSLQTWSRFYPISMCRASSKPTEKIEENNLLELIDDAVIGTMRLLGKVGS